MKLVLCPACQDVFKLDYQRRSCKCGAVYGWYHDNGLHATVSEGAVSLGFDNQSLSVALWNRPESGMGKRFEAFVIPVECPTIEVATE